MAIYNTHNPADGYDRVDFHADRRLQSRELNELQSLSEQRLRGIAGALFDEGSIIRDARCWVDLASATASLEAGALYVAGAVRGVPPAQLPVAIAGTVQVGVYLQTEVVSEIDEPALRNPAVGTRGYLEAGASRTRRRLVWGVAGDGTPGEFFAVWEIEDGVVKPRDAAPTLSAITQAISRYDRDSSGGTYVVDGLRTEALADADGAQVYSIAAGRARVGGAAVELPVARRLVLRTAPDTAQVDAEPHVSDGPAAQHIEFDRTPVDISTVQVRIMARRTVNVTHGSIVGAADPLPDSSVLVIESVTQGATTFQQGADWLFVGGQLDWSPGGAEPAPGSSYSVTYQHKTLATPQNLTATSLDVVGSVAGTLIELTYRHKLRRIDAIVIDADGQIGAVRGVPHEREPAPPVIPGGHIELARVHQRWDDGRRIELSAVRTVAMAELVRYDTRLDDVNRRIAELRLAVSVAGRYSGIKHGQFADPMLDESMRDAGIAQTAHIAAGWLQLDDHIDATIIDDARATSVAMQHTLAPLLKQPLHTGWATISPVADTPYNPNPVDLPPVVTLTITPPIDRWSAGQHQARTAFAGFRMARGETMSEEDLRAAAYEKYLITPNAQLPTTIRPRQLLLALTGLRPGEAIQSCQFAGLPVGVSSPPGAATADASGRLTATINIPEGVPSGTVAVQITGTHGSTATNTYTAQPFASVTGHVWYYGTYGKLWTSVNMEIDL